MIVGVPGRVYRMEPYAAQFEWLPVFECDIRTACAALRRVCNAATRFALEVERRRNMVGMHVRLDGARKLEAELSYSLQVALPLGHCWIDQHGLSGRLAAEEVCIRAR